MTRLCLIPEPASIEFAAGSQTFSRSVAILISKNAGRGEWLAAQQVQAALSARGVQATVQPRTRRADSRGDIVLAGEQRDRATFPDVSPHPHWSDASALNEAYRLTIEADRIVVMGVAPAGVAHGARTLIQLLDTSDALPCLTIDDAPALPWCGVMLDTARGKVPSLATLQTIVDIIASFKLNMLQLYTESTFAFRSRPRIGLAWGVMTPEKVVALDVYCRDRYVELVPCF